MPGIPIFVVGAQRSGTTLLRLMLCAHPDIGIPPECEFLIGLRAEFGNGRLDSERVQVFIDRLLQYPRFENWRLGREELEKSIESVQSYTYSDLCSAVYQAYISSFFPSATRWGDKNPNYLVHLDTLLDIYPSAKVVHIVRDPRAVYSSVKRKWSKEGRKVGPNSMTASGVVVNRWRKVAQVSREYAASKRYMEVKYEDLLSRTAEVLAAVAAHVGVSFDDRMLAFHDVNTQKKLVPTKFRVIHQKTFQPVDSDRIDGWKSEISSAERYHLEFALSDELRQFGYSIGKDTLWRSIIARVTRSADILRQELISTINKLR